MVVSFGTQHASEMELTFDQHGVIADTWIIDLNAFHIVVVGVVLLQHIVGNVWDVLSGIGLSSDVDIGAGHVECGDEVLPESSKISRDLIFAGDVSRCIVTVWREAGSNGLIDVDHVGQVDPREWIGLWGVSARLPQDWAILLEETVQGAAAWTAVEPNSDFVRSGWIGTREKPEPQRIGIGRVTVDGKRASI